MKLKPLKNLIHQFGHHDTTLQLEHIVQRLFKHGLVELIPPNRYRETALMRQIPRDMFDATINQILRTPL